MLSKILTAVLLVSAIACKKEYRKEDNKNVETVNELNDGNYQSVINKSSQKENLSPRERYYLASAYSQSGGVDVFSLYSVMEIQLFHKKALDWSDLSKEKNPYLKFMKNQEGIDYEKRQKKREERWEKYLPKIKEKRGIKHKTLPTLEELQTSEECSCADLTQEQYQRMDSVFKALIEKFKKEKVTLDTFDDRWYMETYENAEHEELRLYPGYYAFGGYYGDTMYLELLKQRYLHPEENDKQLFGGMQWEMLYMNILWNTYEAIPLMKKLPILSNEQQDEVTKAMDTYLPLLKNKEFKEVTLRNLMILSGVSLLSVYSSSFDLEEVDSIQDLYCSFEPNAILDNYGLVRKRVLFLQKAYLEADLQGKDYEKIKDQIEAMKESLPEELTQEQKDNFVQGIDKFKVDSCFNG